MMLTGSSPSPRILEHHPTYIMTCCHHPQGPVVRNDILHTKMFHKIFLMYHMTKSLIQLQLFNYFETELHTVPLPRSAPEDQVQAGGEGGRGRTEVHLSAGRDDGLLQVEGHHVQQGSHLVIQVSSYLAQRHQVLHRG